MDPVKQPIAGMMNPIQFGSRYTKWVGGYADSQTMKVTFLTDKKTLLKYLPDCFKIEGEPLVYVYCTQARDIGWLAGANYNMFGVDVPCTYKSNGTDNNYFGKFCLVLWENLTDPILTGRELQGIPKIFANIEDHVKTEGEYRTNAHYRGHKIVDMTIKETKKMTKEDMEAIRKRPGQDWFGWKYMPKTGEEGADVSYPTLYPLGDGTWEGVWGEGKVEWHELTWEQNPTQFHIVNALKALPILEYREATVCKTGWPPPPHAAFKVQTPAGPPRLWRPLK
ncbi:MAG: acetoacetate decarboxylase family protein [Dehalococcoidales bacterium]|nr:acetoacetate decarboxylase family protein [Dehalococcoidales bacterium]